MLKYNWGDSMAALVIYFDDNHSEKIEGKFTNLCEKLRRSNNLKDLVFKELGFKNGTAYEIKLIDDEGNERRPFFKEEFDNINEIFKDMDFIKEYINKCPHIFSDKVIHNIGKNKSYYEKITCVEMLRDLDDLYTKNKKIYYDFLIELFNQYDDYFINKKDLIETEKKHENNNLSLLVNEVLDELKDVDNYNSSYGDGFDSYYDFFKKISKKNLPVPLVYSRDFEETRKLYSLLNKCNIEKIVPFSKSEGYDFIIYMGHDILEDLKRISKYESHVLGIELDNINYDLDDSVITIVNGFDEERILDYLVDYCNENIRVRKYE